MKPCAAVLLCMWAVAVVVQSATVPGDPAAADGARVRAHLARAERALRIRDVSRLGPTQRLARGHVLDVLHAYWTAGVFPHNHDFPAGRRPSFVDEHGTRCAMAYVIEAAGGGALVQRVATTANHSYVRQLAGDPELAGWLERNGMTLEEAARVQPDYGYHPPNPIEARRRLVREFHAAVLPFEGAAIALNVPRTWRSAAGGSRGVLNRSAAAYAPVATALRAASRA